MRELCASGRSAGHDRTYPYLLARARSMSLPLAKPQNFDSSESEENQKGPDLLVRTPEVSSPETSSTLNPIEEGSEGVSAVSTAFGLDMTDTLTGPPSHELPLQERSHHLLSEIDSVLETSPSIALDREA
eukprot:6208948-Pleurochrysis_carterae.AAC.1